MAELRHLQLISMTAFYSPDITMNEKKKTGRKFSGCQGFNPSLGLCKESKNSNSISGSFKHSGLRLVGIVLSNYFKPLSRWTQGPLS